MSKNVSKKMKMEGSLSKTTFDDSDDEASRDRSPSPTRKKDGPDGPDAPSQEAAHAKSKASGNPGAAMVSKLQMIKRESESRTSQGRKPINLANGNQFGEAALIGLVVGYKEIDSKMNICVVPISVAPKAGFDVFGNTNPYLTGMIATHRPNNPLRPDITTKDRAYKGAFPKTVTWVPNGNLVEGVEGQIAMVSAGSFRRLNQFIPNVFKGGSSVPVSQKVGDLVTYTSINAEDINRKGYDYQIVNKTTKELEDASVYERRLDDELKRDMSDRKYALKFKSLVDAERTNVAHPGSRYKPRDIVKYLYNNSEFQEHITTGLMSAHAGWCLPDFDAGDHAEEDVDTKRLQYEGAKTAATSLQKKRSDDLRVISKQLTRNLEGWKKKTAQYDNLAYHQQEPGTQEKEAIVEGLVKELEKAADGEESKIKPWDMPYASTKYATTLVFMGSADEGFGAHTHDFLNDKAGPKTFTDFVITAVRPKDTGYGHMLHVHTTTVANRETTSKELERGAIGALLESCEWYAPNGGTPPLLLSAHEGVLSVAWKVRSLDHLKIITSLMAIRTGNGIITTLFNPREKGADAPLSPSYVDMIYPDPVAKAQAVGLQVTREWLQKHLCKERNGQYNLYPIPLEKGKVADTEKTSAFASDATLMADRIINLHEMRSMVEFKNIIDREGEELSEEAENHNLKLEYRILTCVDDQGNLLDLDEEITNKDLAHMCNVGTKTTEEAEGAMEAMAAKAGKSIQEFLKLHTIPYAILVNKDGVCI